jgi:hypothetical protein
MFNIIKRDGSCAQHASDRLLMDRNFILTAMQTCPYAFQWAHTDLKKDKEIVTTAVKLFGQNYRYVTNDELRNDPEIFHTAVQQDGAALCDASLFSFLNLGKNTEKS